MRALHPNPNIPSRYSDSITWRRMKSVSSTVEDNTTVLANEIIWKPSSSGSFTFKTAYNLFRPTRCVTLSSTHIWSKKIPKKISVFMWRLLHRHLPFPDRLQKFGFHQPSVCPFCWKESASLEHCMWSCSCTLRIWNHYAALLDINLRLVSSVRSACQVWWLADPPTRSETGWSNVTATFRDLMPCFILWILWKKYNTLIHDGGRFSHDRIIHEVKQECFDLSIVHPFRSTKSSDRRFIEVGLVAFFTAPKPKKTLWIKWHHPPSGRLKLNSDAAFSSVSCGGGAVLRNSNGALVAALSFPLSATSALEAEALALDFTMRWCELAARKPTLIEVDSSVLVYLILHNDAPIPWKIRQSVINIRQLLSTWSASIAHSFRETNMVADSLAKFGCSLLSPSLFFTFNSLPPSVFTSLLYDWRGFLTPRLIFQ